MIITIICQRDHKIRSENVICGQTIFRQWNRMHITATIMYYACHCIALHTQHIQYDFLRAEKNKKKKQRKGEKHQQRLVIQRWWCEWKANLLHIMKHSVEMD